MDECAALEMRLGRNPLTGSNPVPSASRENANLKRSARDAERAARLGFERAFLAKRKRIYQ